LKTLKKNCPLIAIGSAAFPVTRFEMTNVACASVNEICIMQAKLEVESKQMEDQVSNKGKT
jgi:hypothetical protein